mmetsp:Transcript_16434/g.27865  ORF Transcript_16434/g.27865 Transcript_16434/m.27865 type:complete len:86 (+) Transcript_16434:606-863(+)
MYLSSRAIYWSFGMGVVYSFVFIYLMSAFAETIAWICITLIQLALIAVSVGCLFLWNDLVQKNPNLNPDQGTDEERKYAQQVIDN